MPAAQLVCSAEAHSCDITEAAPETTSALS